MSLLPVVVTVVMGIVAGGMVALALIGPRQTQTLYGILALVGLVFGLVALLLVLGPQLPLVAVVSNVFNLVLAGFIGYAVTTIFVLSYRVRPDYVMPDAATVQAAQALGGKTAVLYFVSAEPEYYDIRVVARTLDTLDYPQALPPALLRPFYLLGLKRRYAAMERNPNRGLHFRLAQKVQDRLGKRYKVYIAFYNDHPTLSEAAVEAVRHGARRLIVLHARLTDPPPTVPTTDLLDALHLARYGVAISQTTPLWNSELPVRLFVRRALAATEDGDRAMVGLLLIGPGHPPGRQGAGDAADPLLRQNQELAFMKRARQALIKAGFADDKVVLAWLAWQQPAIPAALQQLAAQGCRRVYWIGAGFLTDGLATLYDIPHLLPAGGPAAVHSLGAWNDDDLVAEALTEKVKQVAAVEQLV